MNIKGASRAGGQELAAHLGNAEKNETVSVVRVMGTVAQDLPGAFAEMEATATGTRCRLPLYHAKISPDPKEPRLTPEQWDRAVEALAKELGMEGHAYALVLHQKYGKRTPDVLREHGHVVFSRIDPETMKAAHDGHNYRRHEIVARQLEREFGHAKIQGVHVERDGQPRPDRTPPEWQMQQATRTGIQPESVADTVKQVWSELGKDVTKLPEALREEGLTLAVGRRDLVVLDAEGGAHTLARCLGLKAAEIRERTAKLDRSKLPTVEHARETIQELKAYKTSAASGWDHNQGKDVWQGTIANAGGEKPNAAAKREEQLIATLATAANDNEAQAIMAAYGYSAGDTATRSKWQELQVRVAAERISRKESFREMDRHMWEQADKERRDAHKEGRESRRTDLDRER